MVSSVQNSTQQAGAVKQMAEPEKKLEITLNLKGLADCLLEFQHKQGRNV
jgi:hypothetical protein